MSSKLIDLTASSALALTSLLYVVDSGPLDRKTTLSDVRTLLMGAPGAIGGVTPGAATFTNVTDSALNPTSFVYAGTAGLLSSALGLVLAGTPNAVAPSAGTNGPGVTTGSTIVLQSADGAPSSMTLSSPGNSSTSNTLLKGYGFQGTAASPSASLALDNVSLSFHGYGATGFTTSAGKIFIRAAGTFSDTSWPTEILFQTIPSSSVTLTSACKIDANQILSCGGGSDGILLYQAGTVGPKLQVVGSTTSSSLGLTRFNTSSGSAPTINIAHSLGLTVGTYTAAVAGNAAGSIHFQLSDGTNLVNCVSQLGLADTGSTISTGVIPGRYRINTYDSSGASIQASAVDSNQVTIIGSSILQSSTLFDGGTVRPWFQLVNNSSAQHGMALIRYRASSSGSTLYFGKTHSSTDGNMTIVSVNDVLGNISFQASDGTNFVESVLMQATVTGTPGSTRVGGNFTIGTATDAAPSVTTTAFTINNAQLVTANVAFSSPLITASGIATTRIVYATTAGLLTSDAAFIRTAGVFSTDAGTDSVGIIGNLKLGFATSGSASAAYLAQTSNFNSTDYMIQQSSSGTTAVNAKTGQNVLLRINNVTKLNFGGTTTVFSLGNVVTFSDTTAAGSGTGAVVITSGGMYVGGSIITGTNLNFSGTLNGQTSTATTSGVLKSANLAMTTAPAGASSATAENYCLTRITTNQNMTATYGLIGMLFEASQQGTSTTTGAVAVQTLVSTTVAGTITNAIGLSCIDGSKFGGSTITNLYGIKVESQTAGTTNYAIYTGTGAIVFGDRQYLNCAASAPTDGNIPTSAVSWYLNEGGNLLSVRVRYSDGTTLKTGTLALV